jgi:hypothetical protein
MGVGVNDMERATEKTDRGITVPLKNAIQPLRFCFKRVELKTLFIFNYDIYM